MLRVSRVRISRFRVSRSIELWVMLRVYRVRDYGPAE